MPKGTELLEQAASAGAAAKSVHLDIQAYQTARNNFVNAIKVWNSSWLCVEVAHANGIAIARLLSDSQRSIDAWFPAAAQACHCHRECCHTVDPIYGRVNCQWYTSSPTSEVHVCAQSHLQKDDGGLALRSLIQQDVVELLCCPLTAGALQGTAENRYMHECWHHPAGRCFRTQHELLFDPGTPIARPLAKAVSAHFLCLVC